ncbi:MAG: rod shape-determining protein MreB [Proteobacteria bacterium]|nr:rod shape-determining protein MreB [Pseudomonadota bacterium]
MIENPLARSGADVALDLGSSNLRVVLRGGGVVFEQPTVIALARGRSGVHVAAIGSQARELLGRAAPGTQVIRPVQGGVIADFEATERLIRVVLQKTVGRSLLKPRILVSVPPGTTEVERRAVQESVRAAGARDVTLAAAPLLAAIGAGLAVSEAVGSFLVEVGGGRTTSAVTSLGGLVVQQSERVAGTAMDDAIAHWLRRKHGLAVGSRSAEALKIQIGSAEGGAAATSRVRGRDLTNGAPREVEVTGDEVTEALAEPIARIRQVVLDTLAQTPPELAGDIMERGAILAGGSGRLRGLDRVLRDATGLPFLLAEEPARCVARGAASLLSDTPLFERVAEAL